MTPLRTFVAAAALAASPALADAPRMSVAKTATCGCCAAWVDHARGAGFDVEPRNVAPGDLVRLKIAAGLTPELASCHTAEVDGYVVEGHVPAEDVRRLLAERPDAVGLAVPGMPLGSPGMDQGPTRERYEVLLVRRDGSTEVWSRHD